MTRQEFRLFIVDPKTSARLDAALADNAQVDAEIRKAQHAAQYRRYIERLFAQTEQH